MQLTGRTGRVVVADEKLSQPERMQGFDNCVTMLLLYASWIASLKRSWTPFAGRSSACFAASLCPPARSLTRFL